MTIKQWTTLDKVKKILKDLKINKVAGNYKIPFELLKRGSYINQSTRFLLRYGRIKSFPPASWAHTGVY